MKIEIHKNGEGVSVEVHGTDGKEVLFTLLETYQNIYRIEKENHDKDCECKSMELFDVVSKAIETEKERLIKEVDILKKMFEEEN